MVFNSNGYIVVRCVRRISGIRWDFRRSKFKVDLQAAPPYLYALVYPVSRAVKESRHNVATGVTALGIPRMLLPVMCRS